MQYIYFIKISDLEKEGLSREVIGLWYATARHLCEKGLLYVTLDNKLPVQVEDIAAYVSEIYVSVRKGHIVIKVETFAEIQDDIITDAKELIDITNSGQGFDAHLGKFGKFITLTKKPRIWPRRNYTLKY